MAEINSLQTNIPAAEPTVVQKPEPVRTTVETADEGLRESSPEKVAERELDNVVAVSEHGDTVQVSEEGEERLETEASLAAADEEESAAQILLEQDEESESAAQILLEQDEESESAAEILLEQNEAAAVSRESNVTEAMQRQRELENEENFEAESTNYAGYTDQQLEQMYMKGEISQSDYQREIDSREERVEAMQQQNSENSEELTSAISEGERASRITGAVEGALASDNETNVSAQTRIDMVNAAENLDNDNTAQALSDEEVEQRQMQDFQVSIS